MEYILIKDSVGPKFLKRGTLDETIETLNQTLTKLNIPKGNTTIQKDRIEAFRKNAAKAINRGKTVFFLYSNSGEVFLIQANRQGECKHE